MTGPPGQPLRAGASVVDIMGGICGAMGILVALGDRERTHQGQLVQNGLFETAAFIVGQHMAYSAISNEPVPPMPARVSAWAIYRVFDTQDDKQVFIGITSDKQWRRFCEAFDRNDLLADETLATNNDRIEARDWLLPELERLFAQMSQGEICGQCEAAGIPFAPVARPEDLFSDPHLNGGTSLLETTMPDGRKAELPRLPVIVGEQDWGLRHDPPKIGEHTLSLLREIGFQDGELRALLKSHVIEHTQ
jgi:crotonobetainyl-CoA:carnitine CoA-transferase CaiB-like acyl-CoA transferase